MAATALVIVMNATFVLAADAVPFISADLIRLTLTFSIDSEIEIRMTQSALSQSRLCILLLSAPC